MTAYRPNGELVPIGGGDNIPMSRTPLTVGRRESCDIRLLFPNISGRHCEFSFREGYWYVRDLGSKNGVKVNGERVQEKLLHDGTQLAIGKRVFTLLYDMPSTSSKLEEEDGIEEVMGKSLMEKAGLVKPADTRRGGKAKRPFDRSQLPEDDDD